MKIRNDPIRGPGNSNSIDVSSSEGIAALPVRRTTVPCVGFIGHIYPLPQGYVLQSFHNGQMPNNKCIHTLHHPAIPRAMQAADGDVCDKTLHKAVCSHQ